MWTGLNTTADHGLQEVETPLREEAVAIHGIEVRVRGGGFREVRAEPGGVVLEARREGEEVVYVVPPLPVHVAVVMER